MSRPRVRDVHDISLSKGDLKRLKKGYRVFKNKTCIFLKMKDRATQRTIEIERLRKKIKELESKRRGR